MPRAGTDNVGPAAAALRVANAGRDQAPALSALARRWAPGLPRPHRDPAHPGQLALGDRTGRGLEDAQGTSCTGLTAASQRPPPAAPLRRQTPRAAMPATPVPSVADRPAGLRHLPTNARTSRTAPLTVARVAADSRDGDSCTIRVSSLGRRSCRIGSG